MIAVLPLDVCPAKQIRHISHRSHSCQTSELTTQAKTWLELVTEKKRNNVPNLTGKPQYGLHHLSVLSVLLSNPTQLVPIVHLHCSCFFFFFLLIQFFSPSLSLH